MPAAQAVSTGGITLTCGAERRKLLSWVLTEPSSFEGATVSEAARYTKCDSSSTRCFLQTTEGPIAIATARARLYNLPYVSVLRSASQKICVGKALSCCLCRRASHGRPLRNPALSDYQGWRPRAAYALLKNSLLPSL